MEKLLVLGSTGRGTTELLLEAKSRGIYTIITDNLSPEKSPVKLIADECWMISTDQIDLLEKKCREEGICGIINGISTFNIGVTMELCRRLGFGCYATPESWHYTVDKRDFKDICIKNGVSVAQDYHVSIEPTDEELDVIKFPVVVKAIDQSANRGMSYCFEKADIKKACDFARSVSNSETVIIEKMLKGKEYAAWYAMADGEIVLIDFGAMLNEPGYPSKCYSVTVTCEDRRDIFMKEIHPFFVNALKEMGCKEGIGWIEMMVDEDDNHIYALEMGYRMSGDMMCLPLGNRHNFNIFGWLVDIAMGKKHTREELIGLNIEATKLSIACSYILFSTKGGVISKIEGIDKILHIPTINIDSRLKVGDTVEDNQYLAVITFNAANTEQLCEVIKEINEKVSYKADDEDIVIRYTDFDTLKKINNI
jgi:biotin carboxylase